MARLPYPDIGRASESVRQTWDALPVKLALFEMLAHADTAIRPTLRLGQAILTELELDPALRELVILLVARLTEAEYEWVQHLPIARAVGVREDQALALERDRIEGPEFDERERALLAFVRQVVLSPRADDATFAALTDRFSPREVVETLITVGFYTLVARVMIQLELEIDEPAGAGALDGDGLVRGRRRRRGAAQ